MSIKVYNSLTRKKEEFTPAEKGRIRMYVCGPTVYALSHIGHARSAVSFDVIYRYFKYRGYEVLYARNYTDVDDKIIKRANEEGSPPEEVAERYIKAFDEDMAALGVEVPPMRPRATETIGKIIEVTERLIERGYAYTLDGDVYFSVRKFTEYGKLSGKNVDELESGARVGVDARKEDPLDFALWKSSKPGEPSWDSPWGKGRPGWHIECSAMIMDILGETIDVHGGGKDLIFPHHENEIAQAEAASGKAPYVRYWLHNGFVNIEKEKMSKSIGNILNIRDALREHSSEALRFFLLSSHYRSPIDYTEESLKEAEAAVERVYKTLKRIRELGSEAESPATGDKLLQPVLEAMDDDFNTAEALGVIFKEINRANRVLDRISRGEEAEEAGELTAIADLVKKSGAFLGLFHKDPDEYFEGKKAGLEISPEEIERLIEERARARKDKDYARADAIRDELLSKGVAIEDTPGGTVWSAK